MGEQAKFLIDLALAWLAALYGKTKKPSAVVAAMTASLPANSNHSGRRRSIDASRDCDGR
jgi:hypothetical protein